MFIFAHSHMEAERGLIIIIISNSNIIIIILFWKTFFKLYSQYLDDYAYVTH